MRSYRSVTSRCCDVILRFVMCCDEAETLEGRQYQSYNVFWKLSEEREPSEVFVRAEVSFRSFFNRTLCNKWILWIYEYSIKTDFSRKTLGNWILRTNTRFYIENKCTGIYRLGRNIQFHLTKLLSWRSFCICWTGSAIGSSSTHSCESTRRDCRATGQ